MKKTGLPQHMFSGQEKKVEEQFTKAVVCSDIILGVLC